MMKIPTTNAQAHKTKIRAVQYRDSQFPSITDRIAIEEMEKIADQKLQAPVGIRRGTGGELLPALSQGLNGLEMAINEPTMVAVEASLQRIDLADKAGVFDMAFDAAETIGAKNAIEQMLAHQMAAAHKVVMNLFVRSSELKDVVAASRLINAAARVMEGYQKAMLTLAKSRNGGKQLVTVQHVQIASGAQAVVAGEINTRVQRGGESEKAHARG